MAKVLQSAAGAMAVMDIWSMVLAEMCSDVVGSNWITLPWIFPVSSCQSSVLPLSPLPQGYPRTESNIAILHPRGARQVLVGRKPRDLVPREQIPDDGRLAGVVAHHEPAGTDVAGIVDGQQLHLLGVAGEAALDGQRVVVGAHDRVALGVEEHGGRGGGWLKESRGGWWCRR